LDVEAQRAGRVRWVGRVHAAPGEAPEEPAVDGAEGELTARRGSPELGLRLQQPGDLRPREVRVADQAGPGADDRLETVGPHPLADRRRAPALPHDRAMDR